MGASLRSTSSRSGLGRSRAEQASGATQTRVCVCVYYSRLHLFPRPKGCVCVFVTNAWLLHICDGCLCVSLCVHERVSIVCVLYRIFVCGVCQRVKCAVRC